MSKFGETMINGRKVSTIQLDGETWYKGLDVCGAAGYGDWQRVRDTKLLGEDLRLLTHRDDLRIRHSTYYINDHALNELIPREVRTVFNGITAVEEIVKASGVENETVVLEHPMFGMVRVRVEDEKLLMCASDVAKALGYTNTSKAVGDHCKGVTKRYTPTDGGQQLLNFIPEGDVYRLIVSSKLPAAEQFEHWLFYEMLPSLRKNGAYAMPKQTVSSLDAVSMLHEAANMLEAQIKLTEEQRNKNTELVSRLDGTTHDLVAANDEVRRWREQYYRAADKVETLQNQIEAYRKEFSHRKEFTSFINSCVRSFVGASCGQYIMPTGWNEYYRRLTDVLGDDVRKRGRQPYIDAITDEELPIAMKIAAEMGTGELVAHLMSDTIRNAIAA